MLNAAGAQNSLKAGTGMKTMRKALAGLTTAKKPLVRRLRRERGGEGRSGQEMAGKWLFFVLTTSSQIRLSLYKENLELAGNCIVWEDFGTGQDPDGFHNFLNPAGFHS